MQLKNKGSLITYDTAQGETCLGYVLNSNGHGAFDAALGKVELTSEEIEAHNKALSLAEVQGLDKCEVGQWGTFFFNQAKREVRTWIGELVSSQVHLSPSGKGITFLRNGRQYRGRLQKDADCFNFKRVA